VSDRSFIIVSGLPASGKTIMAKGLAAALELYEGEPVHPFQMSPSETNGL
jgi:cytidylate kinase